MEQQRAYVKQSTKTFDLSREFGEIGFSKSNTAGIGADSTDMTMTMKLKVSARWFDGWFILIFALGCCSSIAL